MRPKSFDVSKTPDISPYNFGGTISVRSASVPGITQATAAAANKAVRINTAGLVERNMKYAELVYSCNCYKSPLYGYPDIDGKSQEPQRPCVLVRPKIFLEKCLQQSEPGLVFMPQLHFPELPGLLAPENCKAKAHCHKHKQSNKQKIMPV